MSIPVEQKTLYRKWEGKRTSFQKEWVGNVVWKVGNHCRPKDDLGGSQYDNQNSPTIGGTKGEGL